MNDSQKTEATVETNDGTPAPASKPKKKTAEEKEEVRRLYRLSLKAPATPLMLSCKQAWKELCARTGGGITFCTFQVWIRKYKVPVVRLGRKIFVPKTILEDLIKQCLAGEPLL